MRFLLGRGPIDYQLSVHHSNYEQLRGVGSFVRDLNFVLQHGGTKHLCVMNNFIAHYGRETVLSFLTNTYEKKGAA